MGESLLPKLEKIIYLIRGQNVMLDSDLAELYGVPTKRLNEAVKRNLERFPGDFMFNLTEEETENLRSQFATSSERHGGRRYYPFVFTESGVAMLSSVLSSPRAIQVNISIMRTFIKLRSFLSFEEKLSDKVHGLEKGTNQLFKVVFQRLDNLEKNLPLYPEDRKKIGLKDK